jgi:TRAP-type C4-dicarboxylate transport system permease small subunit
MNPVGEDMQGYLKGVEKLSRLMNVIAGTALTFIMLLTVSDVVFRYFGMPIVGTFEIVGLGGAVAVGFGIPVTSFFRGHIFVDSLVQKLPQKSKNLVNFITRLTGFALFLWIGYNLFIYSYDLFKSGEVSLTRQIPFYPIGYGIGVCCFVQCLVLIGDMMKIFGDQYE